jgi:hypothetical protein
MAEVGQGSKSYIQFGREATWGAAATAATKRMAFLSQNITPNLKLLKDESLDGFHNAQRITKVMESASGQIEFNLTYNDMMLFFDCAMGTDTYAANGGNTTGANPYTHVFTDEHDFFNSLAFQLIEGNTPTTKCQYFTGAKIVGMTIGFDAAGYVKCTLDMLGKRKHVDQTPTGALTASTPIFVLSSHMTTATDGSGDAAGDIVIRSFEWSIKHQGLETPREAAGSDYVFEPIRNGKTMSRVKIRKEFRTVSLLNDFISQADNPLVFTFASAPSSLSFQADETRIVKFENGVDNAGLIFADIEYEVLYVDATPDYGSKITLVNAQATITA